MTSVLALLTDNQFQSIEPTRTNEWKISCQDMTKEVSS